MGASKTPADAPQPSAEERTRTLIQKQETLTLRLADHAKPTIASLPGVAAGAGLSIALACDIRIAAASTFITTAFRNIGFSGDYGGSWLLTQLIGPSRAKDLYYTARRVHADEAVQLGLFNRVVADEELASATLELARQIASGPPIALGYMKENINRAVTGDLRSCLALEADRMTRCAATKDHKEAVSAFLEKRPPLFSGR
jgi:enoyl-CoA hydratase/carnithine racemase